LNSDIILLQEAKDHAVCAQLAEAIRPHSYQVAICSASEARGGGGALLAGH
jgi:hypothetical protein